MLVPKQSLGIATPEPALSAMRFFPFISFRDRMTISEEAGNDGRGNNVVPVFSPVYHHEGLDYKFLSP
jgi:hypothetical protein